MAATADKVMEESHEQVQAQPSLKVSNGTSMVTTVSSVMTSALPQTTSTLSQSISTPNITISQVNDYPKMSASTNEVLHPVESNKNAEPEPMDTEVVKRDVSGVQTFSGNKNTITIRSLPPSEIQTYTEEPSRITQTIQMATAPSATTLATSLSGPTVTAVSALANTGSSQTPAQVTMPVMYTNIQGNIVPIPAAPIVQVIVVNQCVKPNNANTIDSSKLTPIAPAPVFIQPQSGELVSGVERNVEVVRRRSHVCPYEKCEKTYFKSSHLKAHIRTHTGNSHT